MQTRNFLHNHADFPTLISIVGRDSSIDPALVEKDYWIMHCLYVELHIVSDPSGEASREIKGIGRARSFFTLGILFFVVSNERVLLSSGVRLLFFCGQLSTSSKAPTLARTPVVTNCPGSLRDTTGIQ